jgi:4-hydroxy-2-oxoheptanedioate aldolase
VHGVLLCQAETADAVRAFVEGCRYPHRSAGVDSRLPSAVERMRGAEQAVTPDRLGIGTRGRGSEATAAPIWGLSAEDYIARCEPWPLDPAGELLLGVKLESPEGIAQCEAILAVPGLGFAELGPGDLGLSLGYVSVPREPYPAEMREARERVFAACRKNRLAFLETASPESISAKLDEGVRVIAGHREETAKLGRAHQRRSLPV